MANKLKKRPGNHAENRVHWTPYKIALLGKAKDAEVAQSIGASKSTVTKKRISLGIPPYNVPKSSWGVSIYAGVSSFSFKNETDQQIAERLGVSKNAVKKKRTRLGIRKDAAIKPQSLHHLFTPDVISNLGVLSDSAIARLIGCDSETVRAQRIKRGIEPVIKVKSLPKEAFALLGTIPDWLIAEQFDISVEAVRRNRRKRGISEFQSGS